MKAIHRSYEEWIARLSNDTVDTDLDYLTEALQSILDALDLH